MAGVHGSLSQQAAADAQTALDNYDLASAEARFDYALTLDNDNEKARVGLALTKSGLGKHFEAIDLIGDAKVTPDSMAAKVVVALNAGRNGDAQEAVDFALKLGRKSAAVWSASAANSASKGTEEGWHESIASLSMALYYGGQENTSIRMDRVASYLALNLYDEALADLNKILELKPALAPAHWNKAIALLSKGDWDAGMKEYDWRLKLPWNFSPAFRAINLPMWRGEKGRLLIVQEGGFGDTILALRYLPEIANEVTTLVPERLVSLVSCCETITSMPTDTAQWDYCLPFMSLVPLFNTIPPAPYLDVEPWHGHIPSHRRRMGIAWSAGNNHSRRRVRSVPLDKLIATFGNDYELFSMQNHDHAEAVMRGVHTFEFKDFADLAGLMQLMDTIVAIDTAAIHLAGAIGKPAHLLLDYAPEWRWAYNWYSTVIKHVQRSINNWDDVLEETRKAIQ